MNCSIISVGTELLFGQIMNKNTVYLSQQLNEIGINVYHHFTVGDNSDRLKQILSHALSISDLIITTGGLGPTQDDLTKETVAELLNKKLELNDSAYQKICSYFKRADKLMTKNNEKQAFLPQDSIALPNDRGTAPGFILENKEKTIICLPGPPKEMEHMFCHYVKDYLKMKSPYRIYSRVLRFFGISESSLESHLIDLISNQSNPTIATYAKDGEVTVRLTAKTKDQDEANKIINSMIEKIRKRLNQYIYSYDNEELVEVVAKKLFEKNLKISCAESCTGGLIAYQLTTVPGISKCLDRGIVTYSNAAKIEELDVDPEVLEKQGPVSEETAKEMVLGLKAKTKSDICIAVTGIAGPQGGTKEKPVGLVYIAITYGENILCNQYNISGDRERVRNYTSLLAFNTVRKILEEADEY